MKKSNSHLKKEISSVLLKAQTDSEVAGVILFGSRARRESHPDSDVDLCLLLKPGLYSPLELSRKKMDYLRETDADLQIFQQLPLPLRHRILRDGKILLCKDYDVLYSQAYLTMRQFSRFSRFYHNYLKTVQRGR